MTAVWGGWLDEDWRAQQVGVGVSRVPADPDVALVIDAAAMSPEDLRAGLEAVGAGRPVILL